MQHINMMPAGHEMVETKFQRHSSVRMNKACCAWLILLLDPDDMATSICRIFDFQFKRRYPLKFKIASAKEIRFFENLLYPT